MKKFAWYMFTNMVNRCTLTDMNFQMRVGQLWWNDFAHADVAEKRCIVGVGTARMAAQHSVW